MNKIRIDISKQSAKALRLLRPIWKTLLLTASTVASVSCANLPTDFPKPPVPVLKQTLINQKICKPDGTDCRIANECWFWELHSGTWVHTGIGPLKSSNPEKSCHGSFGLSMKELNAGQEFIRQVEAWCRRKKCDGASINR